MKNNYLGCYIRHLEGFMDRFELWPRGELAFVAVSGGRDSMALLTLLHQLFLQKKKTLKALHINHQLRECSLLDEVLVKEFCADRGIEFYSEKIFLDQHSNLENKARVGRKKIFSHYLNRHPGSVIYLAHHLNDAFEWSLMQQFKQSEGQTHGGIPLVNGKIYRPFMCMSARQIERMVERLSIPFRDDPTNQWIHWERNYIRQKIVPLIEARYPRYLEHYVRQNFLWAKENNQLWPKKKVEKIHPLALVKSELSYILFSIDAQGKRKAFGQRQFLKYLKQEMSFHSQKSRGSWSRQLNKLERMLDLQKSGELIFSGGVCVRVSKWGVIVGPQALMKKTIERIESHETSFKGCEKKMTFVQLIQKWNRLVEYYSLYSFSPMDQLSFPLCLLWKDRVLSFEKFLTECKSKRGPFELNFPFLEQLECFSSNG